MSHAQRFDAVSAQKGTRLYGVVAALKQVAMVVEESYDPNSPEVVGAMQRFEQGLALISGAPEREQAEEPEEESPKRAARGRKAKDDTPTNTAEGQGTTTG